MKEKLMVYRMTPEGFYESSGEWFYPKEAKQTFIGQWLNDNGEMEANNEYLYETKKGNWIRQRFGFSQLLHRHPDDEDRSFCELISPSQAEGLQAFWGYRQEPAAAVATWDAELEV